MLNLLFPKVCQGCKMVLSKEENILCVSCRHKLPLASHHTTGSHGMKDIFYGRFKVEAATALIYFQKKGITQELLHNLKYRGKKEISYFFGKWLGNELADIEDYKSCDMVIPVPLHKQKLKKRGYNQVEGFGKEIANALEIPYRDDILIKVSKTGSQVFKQRFTRFNSEEIFTVQHADELVGKHILLVDDIVTTGATLENCALKLLKNPSTKLSIATIAVA
ncbi:ComF family protein [Ulvibacter antarcticus]|uniref:ComF family protein n=1 Tax=Ulvibacter antarcticus TaxID=442714 RepID=A0A3L9Z2Z8_9FLAO|nr:phosphoribosyltransferase family protein [Ulvibacter antarcticus]RMA65799.1 ComF family protein [Ulvibacter antarcticus]